MNEVRSFERGNNGEEGGRERGKRRELSARAFAIARTWGSARSGGGGGRLEAFLPSSASLSLSLIVVRRAIFYSNTAQLTLALGLGGGGERQERKG